MAQLPCQTRAHVGARLPGPPSVRNQVRSVPIQVDATPWGWRVSTPLARGWAAIARSPQQLAAAIGAAFTEAQVASYARWKGSAYDLDEMTDVVPGDSLAAAVATTTFRHRSRPDQHDPAAWTPLSSGRWRSPSGREYRPDTDVVRRVKARRRELGIDL
jgi:hypothetical protein